jgi:hypothetical protein
VLPRPPLIRGDFGQGKLIVHYTCCHDGKGQWLRRAKKSQEAAKKLHKHYVLFLQTLVQLRCGRCSAEPGLWSYEPCSYGAGSTPALLNRVRVRTNSVLASDNTCVIIMWHTREDSGKAGARAQNNTTRNVGEIPHTIGATGSFGLVSLSSSRDLDREQPVRKSAAQSRSKPRPIRQLAKSCAGC